VLYLIVKILTFEDYLACKNEFRLGTGTGPLGLGYMFFVSCYGTRLNLVEIVLVNKFFNLDVHFKFIFYLRSIL
jgi:hypothetical protein